MPWSTSNIPDLSGKTAVVTGANGGLGLETAREFARKGAHVVMAARNQNKAADARADILAEIPDASLEVIELDLGSRASIDRAAAEILKQHDAIDILVNNAGLMAMPERETEDGFEMQFGVNHLGHWALTSHLMPAILAADAARVVTITSTAHHFGRKIDPDNPHLRGNYTPWAAYGNSKLANYHFGIGLDREFRKAGVAARSLIAHPGLSHTNLQVHTAAEGGTGASGPFWAWMARTTGMTPARGALPQLRAATDSKAKGGQFYGPLFMNNGVPVVRPKMRRIGLSKAIRILWEVSERETGLSLNVEG